MYERRLQEQIQERENLYLRQYVSQLREKFTLERKLLLIQAPQFLFESINIEVIKNRASYVYPPTGLLWLAKSLEGRFIDIKIFDLNLEFLHRVIQGEPFDYRNLVQILDDYLMENEPSIVAVTCLTVYKDLFKEDHPLTAILRYLKEKDKYIVLAGGPTVINEIQGYLSRGLCHFIIAGEGENKINYLWDVFFEEEASNSPTGGIYFKFRNAIEQTMGVNDNVMPRGNLITTYKDINVEKYNKAGSLNPYSRMSGQDKIYSVFQLNRGCRYNCKFCGVRSFMGKGTRSYPLKELIEEIHYLVKERGVRHFEVLDDDFLANPQAAKILLEGLCGLRKKYEITWSANNGFLATSITKDLLNLMRDSGCMGFKIGIESGNLEMLRKIRKPGNQQVFKKMSEILQNYPELFIGGNYIIGLLNEETFGQMLDTFILSCRLNFDWSSFSIFQFTSRLNAEIENLKTSGVEGTDFIPAKDTFARDILEDESLPLGPEVFSLPKGIVPTRKQLKNIWFTFNLVGNYINNKNLKPQGDPGKFISWVEAVQVAYPNNPYMHLFSGLGHILLGNTGKAQIHINRCRTIVGASGNWKYRLERFSLNEMIDRFPKSDTEVYEKLSAIQGAYQDYL